MKGTDSVEMVKLGDIATITRGGNFQKKDFCESGVPCIHYGQIHTKYGVSTKSTISFISQEVANKQKMASKNDVIMAVTSENIDDVCKSVAWLGDEDIAVGGHTAIIHHNQNPTYLSYFFHSGSFYVQKLEYLHDSKVIEFSPLRLKDIRFPLRPLSDQQHIVHVLDTLSDLIEMRKEQISKLDELEKSLFVEMFGDPVENPMYHPMFSLNDICLKITDGTHDTPLRCSSGFLLITGKNIRSSGIIFNEVEYVSPEDHKLIYERCNPEFGDVLYTNIGVVGTAAYNILKFEFSMKNVALLKPKKELLNGRYLWMALNIVRPMIINNLHTGGVQSFMGLATIKKIQLPLPPIKVQNEFAICIEKIEEQRTVFKHGIAKLEEEYKALMQEYFG